MKYLNIHSHGKVLLILKLFKCLVVPDEKGAYLISPAGGRQSNLKISGGAPEGGAHSTTKSNVDGENDDDLAY